MSLAVASLENTRSAPGLLLSVTGLADRADGVGRAGAVGQCDADRVARVGDRDHRDHSRNRQHTRPQAETKHQHRRTPSSRGRLQHRPHPRPDHAKTGCEDPVNPSRPGTRPTVGDVWGSVERYTTTQRHGAAMTGGHPRHPDRPNRRKPSGRAGSAKPTASRSASPPPVPGLIDGTPMAPIDWPEAIAALDRGRLPCSGGEDAAVSARGNAARAREPGMRRRARRRTAVRAARNRTRCSGRRRW